MTANVWAGSSRDMERLTLQKNTLNVYKARIFQHNWTVSDCSRLGVLLLIQANNRPLNLGSFYS